MATYVHNRAFKTKREEYEEKLKQRNENEQWIFGNTFGRPGGGAPLRDKNGNVVSNLKTISNGNIFKYDAQEFTKGDNNVYSINHKIYDANVNKVINDPFTPFRNYINQFDPNNNVNKNINIDNNQGYLIPDNNININQNPYLIQLPDGNYGILSPYPLIQPMPNINLNNINYPINNNFSINENIKEEIPQQQRPYSSINLNEINNYNANNTNISNIDNNNINNKINTDINNISNNLNNTQYKTSITGAPRKFLKKIPESTLFNEAAQERVKLEKERKNDLWKKELLDQIKEKRRRDEIKRKEMEEKEKREELENEKYIKFKKKQREEHAKKIKEEQEKRLRERMQSNQSQSVVNILDLSNNIDQANKSIMSNNNITFREGNLNELSQNNLNINNNENENENNEIINNNENNANINEEDDDTTNRINDNNETENYDYIISLSFIIQTDNLKFNNYQDKGFTLNGLERYGCQTIIYMPKNMFYLTAPSFCNEGYCLWNLGWIDVKNQLFYQTNTLTENLDDRIAHFSGWLEFLQSLIDDKIYTKLFEFFGFDKANLSNGDRLIDEEIFIQSLKALKFSKNNEDNILEFIVSIFRHKNKVISFNLLKRKISSNLKNFSDEAMAENNMAEENNNNQDITPQIVSNEGEENIEENNEENNE